MRPIRSIREPSNTCHRRCVHFDGSMNSMVTVVKISPEGASPNDRHFVTIDPLLGADECRTWIELAEQIGFEDAPINLGGGRQERVPDIRNNRRAILDDPDRAATLWQRAHPLLPTPILRSARAHAIGLNERL